MVEPKVTTMVIKVDLQCEKCYKKIKKVLCKFPEIRDQVYDEKTNTVAIKVLCCSPEKIKHKIASKGGESVKSIEIVVPPKPKEEPKKQEPKKEEPKKQEPKKDEPKKEEPKKQEPKKEEPKPKPSPAPEKLKLPEKPKDPVEKATQSGAQALAPVTAFPIGVWYEGGGAGPSYRGHGYPPVPVKVYDGYYGRPVYDSWGGGGHRGGYYVSNNPNYFGEENPTTCSIM